jgi:hypothetical protein
MRSQPPLIETQRQLAQHMIDNDVEFVVIGGHAARANGLERETYDLDVVLNLTPITARKLATYFSTIIRMVDVEKLIEGMMGEGNGQIPFDIQGIHHGDLLTRAKGIPFSEIMSRPVAFGDQVLPVAMRLDVIRLKELVFDSDDPPAVKKKHQDDIESLKKLELESPQDRSQE